MLGRRLFITLALLIMIVVPALAQAEKKPNLVLSLTVEKQVTVLDDEGREKTEWHKVSETDPGDVLRYTLLYKNEGGSEAIGATIVDPIPQEATYVGGSASGEGTEITYSLDGKLFHSQPKLRYKVKEAGGLEVEYEATPEMYTHIKWKLVRPVYPGGSGRLHFKVKVK